MSNTTDLTPYLTREERKESFGLSFGAGEFTANDRRLAELVVVAEGRLEDQMGVMAPWL
jgi:hypothetical protein